MAVLYTTDTSKKQSGKYCRLPRFCLANVCLIYSTRNLWTGKFQQSWNKKEFYRQQGGTEARSNEETHRLNDQVEAFAKEAAAAEEARFTAALAEAQEHASSHTDDPDASSRPPRPVPQNAAPRSSSAQSMREAALAKLAKARQYVKTRGDVTAPREGASATTSQHSSAAAMQSQSGNTTPVIAAAWGKGAIELSKQVSSSILIYQAWPNKCA